MDVQRYISSGIIESYVAGLVSGQEARELEAAIAQYPEVAAAVEAVRQDMERYVQMLAQQPPAGIKERLIDMLEQEEAAENAAVAGKKPLPAPVAAQAAAAGPLPSRRIWQYVAAAAILLFLASLVMNLIYLGRYNNYKKKYEELLAARHSLAEERAVFEAKLQLAQHELDLMKDPGFKWIKMLGAGEHAGSVATICWNPQTRETFILAQALPEPPPGKQYQLWAIVNGKPVDAGVFELGSKAGSMQKVKDVAAAEGFAVTLEKAGGSSTPSMGQLFVAGKV